MSQSTTELLRFVEKFNMAAVDVLYLLELKADGTAVSGMSFSVS